MLAHCKSQKSTPNTAANIFVSIMNPGPIGKKANCSAAIINVPTYRQLREQRAFIQRIPPNVNWIVVVVAKSPKVAVAKSRVKTLQQIPYEIDESLSEERASPNSLLSDINNHWLVGLQAFQSRPEHFHHPAYFRIQDIDSWVTASEPPISFRKFLDQEARIVVEPTCLILERDIASGNLRAINQCTVVQVEYYTLPKQKKVTFSLSCALARNFSYLISCLRRLRSLTVKRSVSFPSIANGGN